MVIPLGGGTNWIAPFMSASSRVAQTGEIAGQGWASMLSGVAGGITHGSDALAAKRLRREAQAREDQRFEEERADRLKQEQFHEDVVAYNLLDEKIKRLRGQSMIASLSNSPDIETTPEMKAQAASMNDELQRAMRDRDFRGARLFNTGGGQASAATDAPYAPSSVPAGARVESGGIVRSRPRGAEMGNVDFARPPAPDHSMDAADDAYIAETDSRLGPPDGRRAAPQAAALTPDDGLESMVQERARLAARHDEIAAMAGAASRGGDMESAATAAAFLGAWTKRNGPAMELLDLKIGEAKQRRAADLAAEKAGQMERERKAADRAAKAPTTDERAARIRIMAAARADGFKGLDAMKGEMSPTNVDAAWGDYEKWRDKVAYPTETAGNKADLKAQAAAKALDEKRVALRAAGIDVADDADPDTVMKAWDKQQRAEATKSYRSEMVEIRRSVAEETERAHRADEQFKAMSASPDKDRMKVLKEQAAQHRANANAYGDVFNEAHDKEKAKAEIEAARKAMDEFDSIAAKNGMAGTGGGQSKADDSTTFATEEEANAAFLKDPLASTLKPGSPERRALAAKYAARVRAK